MQANDHALQKLQFYVTTGYTCNYLPKKMAQNLIATPQDLVNAETYSSLIQQGFRRSGKHTYRPHCETCKACISTRIIVADFAITRSQKRSVKQHRNLVANILPIGFHQDHFALYKAYQSNRHAETTPDDTDAQENAMTQYKRFICDSNVDSVMIEFREGETLKMVSIIDIVHNGISAVYTFYDSSNPKTSYGTYNVIWQVNWAKSLNLDYLYLGYWIAENTKMAYKNKFKPQEKLIDGAWLID